MVIYGELSLSGSLRPVTYSEIRLREASKLGFTRAAVPAHKKRISDAGIKLEELVDLASLLSTLFEDK